VIATVAPLVASLVLFAITQSPFTLVFAALGPVIAVASFADSRLGSRRTAKREGARFERDLAAAFDEVQARHARERALRREATPGAPAIVARAGADPYRWRAEPSAPILVSLGRGETASAIEVDGGAATVDAIRARLDELAAAASTLDDAPVSVDARLGVGIVGPSPLAEAVLRAILVQLAWSVPPSDWWMSATGLEAESEWIRHLPHEHRAAAGASVGAGARGARVELGLRGDDDAIITVAIASTATELPAACRIIVACDRGAVPAIVGHPDPAERRSFRAEVVSRREVAAWAPALAREATREGLVGAEAVLPSVVTLESLLAAADGSGQRVAVGAGGGPPASGGLRAAFALGSGGPVEVDLVEHGPHAIVGGTTGSGKSELLIAWVVAMAARHPPDRVSFLLVDFKGGSAFAALEALPHTVGVMTDLDEHGALRALESLRAELRHRERALVDAGARDIRDVPGMPRLVIVVDEFAAMLADHPDLHALFADLAARGRSLGIHLVLCTQRPAGVVRDAVLANTDLRISLRVNNRTDSSAVIGTDAAAAIPAVARGRALLSLAGATPQPVQAALASEDDARIVAARWRGHPPPRRPWVEPLPAVVPLADLGRSPSELGILPGEPLERDPTGAPAIPFGLLDLPHEQRRSLAAWDPASQGNLLVLGAAGSGVSTALASIAEGATAAGSSAVWLPREVTAAWDVVADAVADVDAGRGGTRILVIDDLDALVARMPPDHRTEWLDRLARVLRDGPQHGLAAVLAARRVTGELQSLAGLAPTRLMLRHANRQDWVLAGGDGSAFVDGLPPGRGAWLGHEVQVAVGDLERPMDPAARRVTLADDRALAVITSRIGAIGARLTASGYDVVPLAASPDPAGLAATLAAALAPDGGAPRRVAIVGDVDDWQSRWGAIAAFRPIAELVFDGCTPADLRALTRSRDLPPPIGRDEAWRLDPDGTFARTFLPGAAAGRSG
jgi:S-DNA-T family DNA segregation ATPase FtsK/SpoIIIE